MRKAFIQTLMNLADQDERIFLVTGDLGYRVVEPFAERFPDRFINAGVAEQNMIGVATGMAESGLIPFVYSIATFATLRPYEFLRNGPILHNLPVRIVGVGGGVEYSHHGQSHFGLDDIGALRVQSGLTLITPADSAQMVSALTKTWTIHGPIYYRLSKNETLAVPGLDGRFELGQIDLVCDGADTLIIAMGNIAEEAVKAQNQLSTQNIHASVAVVSSINPCPSENLIETISRFKQVFTVEAHYLNNGLGSMVAEIIAENGLNARLTRFAVVGSSAGAVGSQEFLYDRFRISAKHICETVARTLHLAKQ